MKALRIDVYRHEKYGDCTNCGISSKYDELIVLCDEGWIEIDENNLPENAVKVVKREPWYGKTIYHLEPCKKAVGVGWMFGGNYASTSDSRFAKMVGDMYGAVAIHDRDESQELYNALSH